MREASRKNMERFWGDGCSTVRPPLALGWQPQPGMCSVCPYLGGEISPPTQIPLAVSRGAPAAGWCRRVPASLVSGEGGGATGALRSVERLHLRLIVFQPWGLRGESKWARVRDGGPQVTQAALLLRSAHGSLAAAGGKPHGPPDEAPQSTMAEGLPCAL